jgi:hypothetical protein
MAIEKWPITALRNGKVGHVLKVRQQVKSLHSAAKDKDAIRELAKVMERAYHHLESHPLEWGDPIYDTIKENGTVFHKISAFLSFHYVVYRRQKTVCILDIRDTRVSE